MLLLRGLFMESSTYPQFAFACTCTVHICIYIYIQTYESILVYPKVPKYSSVIFFFFLFSLLWHFAFYRLQGVLLTAKEASLDDETVLCTSRKPSLRSADWRELWRPPENFKIALIGNLLISLPYLHHFIITLPCRHFAPSVLAQTVSSHLNRPESHRFQLNDRTIEA